MSPDDENHYLVTRQRGKEIMGETSNSKTPSQASEKTTAKIIKNDTKVVKTKSGSFVDRLIGKATDGLQKPEPTFFKGSLDTTSSIEDTQWSNLGALRKPLGLSNKKRNKKPAIETPQTPINQPLPERETRGKRLSRNELEAMLDQFYETVDEPTPPSTQTPKLRDGKIHHARKTGNKMVQKMAMASSVALLLGFGVGLYSLSNQGADTIMGQKLNQAIANMGSQVASLIWQPSQGSGNQKIALAREAWTNKGTGMTKPIKTASLMVADASGTIAVGIPLKLTLNTPVGNSFVEVKVTNVPADAVLTAGTRQNNGVWVLKPNDLDHVQLVLSSEQEKPLKLNIELIEAKTGELLTPPREIKVSVVSLKPFKVGGL